jgi:tripartite-type tricarboxylate transporter receptor subunit TctC
MANQGAQKGKPLLPPFINNFIAIEKWMAIQKLQETKKMISDLRRTRIKRMAACLASGLALAAAVALPGTAIAAYPEKPISLVVPYPPGGATDIIGRVVAQKLGQALGQSVVVENRGGAGGDIGAAAVARAAPDGYTLLMGALTSHSIMQTLEKKTITYDLEKDFSPITMVGSVPLVFVVHPSVPAENLKQLIAYAKSKPGYLTYASSGPGAPQRMAAELFKRMAGVDILHIPYNGSGPAMNDLVGGQVLTMVETVPAALGFIKSGRLRALAVSTPERIVMLPDVPTAAEAGLPGFDVSSMFGVLAPAGTPQSIIKRLNTELVKILQMPDVKERLLQLGTFAVFTTPEQTKARIHKEITQWATVIDDAKIKLD